VWVCALFQCVWISLPGAKQCALLNFRSRLYEERVLTCPFLIHSGKLPRQCCRSPQLQMLLGLQGHTDLVYYGARLVGLLLPYGIWLLTFCAVIRHSNGQRASPCGQCNTTRPSYRRVSVAVVTCPWQAAGAPSCTCNRGYAGTLTFVNGAWNGTCSGTCSGLSCPRTAPLVLFDLVPDHLPTSTKSAAACPANASGAPNCVCRSGYTGALSWDDANDRWLGTCSGMCCGLRPPDGNS
jgi:hypothetical protein